MLLELLLLYQSAQRVINEVLTAADVASREPIGDILWHSTSGATGLDERTYELRFVPAEGGSRSTFRSRSLILFLRGLRRFPTRAAGLVVESARRLADYGDRRIE